MTWATSQRESFMDLAKAVIDITGSKTKIVDKDLPEDNPKQRQPGITLARNLLDREPECDLRMD